MKIVSAGKKMIVDFAREEEGAQVVEYGMIIGAVSIALVVALKVLNTVGFTDLVNRIGGCLSGSASCTG